jgi:hypothetical protein
LLNKDYDFKIRATASGRDYVISEIKSLRVGCTSSMSIIKPENFSSKRALIGTNPKKIFEVKPLEISRPYCKVFESIIDEDSITVNGQKGNASDIKFSDPSDPVSSFLDVATADVPNNYTYLLIQKIKGGI